ncbi:MAG: HisA/HisF-related TIM barrel protein [Betaproteobacteria bacterium]
MEIIPVIDLMHQQVVHAQFGQRQHYQPIQSQLCQSSAPMDIVSALLELYPFERLYIADLDAITGQGNHLSTILHIQTQYPNIEIWLDAGIGNVEALALWSSVKITHVIGSENIYSMDDLARINQALHADFVLSLDFNQTGFLGCPELLSNRRYWPEKIIAMTLNQVGSMLGVDIDRLHGINNIERGHRLYAAGGVRNNQDINTLQRLKIAGALVATALHNKSIKMSPSHRLRQ